MSTIENTQPETPRIIQDTAAQAAKPISIAVVVSDPKDPEKHTSIPAVLAWGKRDGSIAIESILNQVVEANKVVHQLRLAQADRPDFRQGTANLQSIASFIDHAKRFASESSAVWADASARRLVSVLDYHPAGHGSAPAWGRHRGVYPCPLSEAWKAWGGDHGRDFNQEEFAELLDARDRELTTGFLPGDTKAPDPSHLITLANNLEVYSTATAKRERDQNGKVRLSYSEEKGVSGTVMPPPAFLILIPVFEDLRPTVLEVRLRVTVKDGHAVFSVKIHDGKNVLRTAFGELCDRVATETSLPVFSGTPE